MKRRTIANGCTWIALIAICMTTGLNHAFSQQPGTPVGHDEIEIMTRGPVHEAFAETVVFDPEPGLVIPKTPPVPIEELPPEHQPEGDNIFWIPGYWAWDDDRNDFLWVSGIWRALPPGRQWIPGYWVSSGQGAQWVAGYWIDAKIEEIDYLPEPPASVETGPNITAPSVDHSWLPGCWIWHQNRYAWRPGYWAPGQTNWNWIPARYVWTPRGYVFVDGYYDYTVDRRGVLFAPVYFTSNVYTHRGFSYSPTTVINPAVFVNHLFLRSNYSHYYFGDYYGTNYATRGFAPGYSYHANYSGYDPFYVQQRWQHRTDQQWTQRIETDYARRHDNEQARPPRTWRSQRDRFSADAANVDTSFRVGTSLEELIKDNVSPLRFQPLANEERTRIGGQRGQEMRSHHELRHQLEVEAAGRGDGAPERTITPTRARLAKSQIVGSPLEGLDRGNAPPKVLETPLPDPRIEPQPRQPRGTQGLPPIGGQGPGKGGLGPDKGGQGPGKGGLGPDKGGQGPGKGDQGPDKGGKGSGKGPGKGGGDQK